MTYSYGHIPEKTGVLLSFVQILDKIFVWLIGRFYFLLFWF